MMRSQLTLLLVVVLTTATAAAQTTTTTRTGKLTVVDKDNFFGQGNAVSIDTTTASFVTAAHVNTTLNAVDAVAFTAALSAQAGNIWTLALVNNGKALAAGTFFVDGVAVLGQLSFNNGILRTDCLGGAGSFTIDKITTNTSASTNTDVVTALTGRFLIDCVNVATTLSGTFDYAATTTTSGGGGGGGGGSGGTPTGGGGTGGIGQIPGLGKLPGGSGGGSTPPPVVPPTPTVAISVVPPSLTTPFTGIDLVAGDTSTIQLTISAANFTQDVTFSASGGPGLTFTFDPPKIASPGSGTTTLTIGTSAGLVTGDQRVTVTARGGGATATTSFIVHVFCDPPIILGLNQPKNTNASNGGTAQLDVTANGSGPLTYQWYQGHRGELLFPIDGGTGRTFTTPALNSTTEFWVRVTNSCGAVDSESATVTVNP